MPYDTREAAGVLAEALGKKYPHQFTANRKAAAADLLQVVIDLAKKMGLSHRTDPKDNSEILVPNAAASGRIWLIADGDGVHVGCEHVGRPTRLPEPEIEYDHASGTWVGTKPETFLTPIPGEPVARRRSAAAAVVDRIVEALAKVP